MVTQESNDGRHENPDLMLPHGDSLKEACGVVGVYANGEEAARAVFFGLYALQHRGQESAGIAASDGINLSIHTEMGLVGQAFQEYDLSGLPGHIAHLASTQTFPGPKLMKPASS